ncbi:BTB/POZ domain-containing protein 17-like [Watersipora subatra]|uniref:BTB/POZ domain-containing protein 17-like n=1 Tax=Watersipora subatra TaxID=2589382 RepID=UPI00355B5FB0
MAEAADQRNGPIASVNQSGEQEEKVDLNQTSVLSDCKSFIEKVSSFFNHETLSDVIIQVGEQSYFAHKFVLANGSDVLKTMLYENRWNDCDSSLITLNETEECQAVFEPFLKFFYTATIELNLANVIGILCLADKYDVRALKHLCQSYMVDHCKSPRLENIQNALIWYPWSKALHLKCLHNQSKATIAWNAKDIMSSPDWLSMEYEFLLDMLSSSDLIIQSELELYEAVQRWLLHILEKHDTEIFMEYCYKLLQLVRFPRMPIMNLHTVEQSQLAHNDSVKEFLTAQLGHAYRFHSLCMAPIKDIQEEFLDLRYQPRDYLDSQVDSVRIQNTMRYAMQVEVKTSPSPLPDQRRDAEWKLSYRRIASTGVWSLHIQCQDATLNNNNAAYESTVIIYDTSDKIIQVVKPEKACCRRGQAEIIDVPLEVTGAGKTMVILIKPVISVRKPD